MLRVAVFRRPQSRFALSAIVQELQVRFEEVLR